MAYKEVSVKQPLLLLSILPYLNIVTFFVFWEAVVNTGIISDTLLASPSQVFTVFIDNLSTPNPDGGIMAPMRAPACRKPSSATSSRSSSAFRLG